MHTCQTAEMITDMFCLSCDQHLLLLNISCVPLLKVGWLQCQQEKLQVYMYPFGKQRALRNTAMVWSCALVQPPTLSSPYVGSDPVIQSYKKYREIHGEAF